MSRTERLTLALRALMEAGVVFGLAYWGVHTGTGAAEKVLLGIAAPAVGFGFWGAVDFHQARWLAEPLRLVQELAISLLAAAALYTAGRQALGITLAALSAGYHVLVYATGGRLLAARDRRPARAAERPDTARSN
jgi:hypothetical protein